MKAQAAVFFTREQLLQVIDLCNEELAVIRREKKKFLDARRYEKASDLDVRDLVVSGIRLKLSDALEQL